MEELAQEINRFYYRDYCTQDNLSEESDYEESNNDSLDIEYRT